MNYVLYDSQIGAQKRILHVYMKLLSASWFCSSPLCFLTSAWEPLDTPMYNTVHNGGFLSFLSGTQEMMVLVFEVNSVWQRILQSCDILHRLLVLAEQLCFGCLFWQIPPELCVWPWLDHWAGAEPKT